jgi:hypothetical protein
MQKARWRKLLVVNKFITEESRKNSRDKSWFTEYGDVTITSEGLQNLGLCSALRAVEQGGIFIVPHLL